MGNSIEEANLLLLPVHHNNLKINKSLSVSSFIRGWEQPSLICLPWRGVVRRISVIVITGRGMVARQGIIAKRRMVTHRWVVTRRGIISWNRIVSGRIGRMVSWRWVSLSWESIIGIVTWATIRISWMGGTVPGQVGRESVKAATHHN